MILPRRVFPHRHRLQFSLYRGRCLKQITHYCSLFKQRFFCGVMVCCLVHKVQMPCQRYLFCGFVYTRHFLMNASTNGSNVSVRLIVSIAFLAEIYQPAKRVVGLQQGRIAHHYQAFARTRHGHVELTVYDAARALVYIFIVGEKL